MRSYILNNSNDNNIPQVLPNQQERIVPLVLNRQQENENLQREDVNMNEINRINLVTPRQSEHRTESSNPPEDSNQEVISVNQNLEEQMRDHPNIITIEDLNQITRRRNIIEDQMIHQIRSPDDDMLYEQNTDVEDSRNNQNGNIMVLNVSSVRDQFFYQKNKKAEIDGDRNESED